MERYLVYICENCGYPQKTPLEDHQRASDFPWTEERHCKSCDKQAQFFKDVLYLTEEPPEKVKCSLYIFKADTGLHKIGCSLNPTIQLQSLRGGPSQITFVWSRQMQDAQQVKRELHQHFQAQRVRGEWFKLSDENIAYIKSLANERTKQCQHNNTHLNSASAEKGKHR